MIHPFERPKWSQQLFSVDWIFLLFELRYHYAIITDKVRIGCVMMAWFDPLVSLHAVVPEDQMIRPKQSFQKIRRFAEPAGLSGIS